ncbi:hypothetical protein [Spirillospora sp. CA-294931]|uniref:hypothetical protein n=1 Tax=Spirillospora sp. CA-294931 TaxID=3240042 RepID=UPI003D8C48E5
MIEKVRFSARGMAVLTAVPLLGIVPLLAASEVASADGPVQVRNKKHHKPSHGRKKKKHARAAQLVISTGAPKAQVVPGRTYSWPYAVTNKGPVKAGPAVFTASLPKALEFVSGQQNCSYAGGGMVCHLGPLKPGQTIAGVMTAKVSGTAAPREAITSTGTVTWARSRVTRAFPRVDVAETADLGITKKAPSVIRPGEGLPYEVTVSNAGPSTATGVVMETTVPAEIVENDTSCTQRGRTFICTLDTLAKGAQKTIRTKVKPGMSVRAGTVLESPSSVRTETTELNLANNQASTRTKVVRPGSVTSSGRPARPHTSQTSRGSSSVCTGYDVSTSRGPRQGSTDDQSSAPREGTRPDQNTRPDNGTTPDQNTRPDQNGKPDNGSKPDQNSKPDNGTKPDQNSKPDSGSKPDQNSKPDNGTKPDQNTKPDNGTKPDQNTKPDNGTKPDRNTRPDQVTTSGEGGKPRVGNNGGRACGETSASSPAGGPSVAPTRAMKELPRTGAETGLMLDVSLGLVGAGLILHRLGRTRRRQD